MKGAIGVVLDAGAFIALEKRDHTMVALAQLFAMRKRKMSNGF